MGHDALFTWIHLSDIHIGHGDANHREDQKLVLGALVKDLTEVIAKEHLKPDAIFVTGDIAFSGACVMTDEYTRAEERLVEIAKAAGVAHEQVYVVPGNHDVQRPVDKSFAAKTMLQALRGSEDLDSALADKDARAHLASRQANYLAFTSKWAPAARSEKDAPRLYWQHRMDARDGVRVRVCGLNTALLAADENTFGGDHGKLALGKRQIVETLAEPAPEANEAVLVLTHHPFTDRWLRDEAEVVGWIRRYAHVHLSGHTHEANAARTITGRGNDFVHLVAGAAHGEREADARLAMHGYSIGALVRNGASVAVQVWPRRWSAKSSVFARDVDVADDATGYAQFPLTRVKASPRSQNAGGGPPRPPLAAVVDRAVNEVTAVLQQRPIVLAALAAQNIPGSAAEVATTLVRVWDALSVLRALNNVAAALTTGDRADLDAVRRIFNAAVCVATDWRLAQENVRRVLPTDPSREPGENRVELPVRHATLAELLLAGVDERRPQFRVAAEQAPVGLTYVSIPAAARAPIALNGARFTEIMVHHLATTELRDASIDPRSSTARVDVESALHESGYMLPAGEACPYYVAFGDDDESIWKVACEAQASEGLASLRLVRLRAAQATGAEQRLLVQLTYLLRKLLQ